MIKSIAEFLPLRRLPVEECERHYVEVHTVLVAEILASLAHVVSYHTNRVLREYDAAGGWRQRPRAWRSAIVREHGDVDAPVEKLPAAMREAVSEDHRNFLRSLRTFGAREATLVDRRNGQTTLVKYTLRFDRAQSRGRAEAHASLLAHARELVSAEDGAQPRLAVLDLVVREARALPLDEEGQTFEPHSLLADTTRCGHLDLYFDHDHGAEAFFRERREMLRALASEPVYSELRVYHVEERCQLDKR